MSIDTIDNLLRIHEEGGTPPTIIEKLRLLRKDQDDIAASGYLPQVVAAKTTAARQQRATEIREALDHVLQVAAAEDQATADQHAHAERERLAMSTGQDVVVDVERISRATNAAEVVVLLKDADLAGPIELRRVWPYAEPKLRALAAREQSHYRMGTAASAFNALVTWQSRMKTVMQRQPDRAQLSEAAQTRQRMIREKALAACRVLGIDGLVEAGARKAALPAAPESAMVTGGWFDRFGGKT
jgi:hypothetical protein